MQQTILQYILAKHNATAFDHNGSDKIGNDKVTTDENEEYYLVDEKTVVNV